MNKKLWLSAVITAYTALLVYWMFFGFGRTKQADYAYNLIPFHTIWHFLSHYSIGSRIWLVNLIGNIGVFVPFGLWMPLVIKGSDLRSFLFFTAGLIIMESCQLIFRRGTLDIDDYILNAAGYFIGTLVLRQVKRLNGIIRSKAKLR